jgi:integrase
LGDRLMAEIDRNDMQRVLDKTARQCGKSMVNHLRFRLRSIFELAVSEGVVDRNPAISLFTPKHTKNGRARKVLAPDELESMLDVLPLREQIIVRLATWEGMRPGEILALQFGDLEGDSIRVRRRLYRGDIDTPKSERSSRQVALTEGTKALLDEWVQSTKTGQNDAWLFPSENGQPIRRDNVWRRYIWPKLNPLGFAWATFQVMRRTYATWSKDNGIDAHTRSAQMGNTVDVNENEYAVASLKQKLAAVRKVEAAVAKRQRGAGSETSGSEEKAAKKIEGW